MSDLSFILIYFFYGLAVFSMGLVVMSEGERVADERLRIGLRQLAAFGLIHGLYEWLEMAGRIWPYFNLDLDVPFFLGIRLGVLSFSFLFLSGFGSYLLLRGEFDRRFALLIPFALTLIWAYGLMRLHALFALEELEEVANVWTRYSLALPGSLVAALGLLRQQREFRRSGLVKSGANAFGAAVAFSLYGLVGQLFGFKTALSPSTFLNQQAFLAVTGFPIQFLRAVMAMAAAYFVVRCLRAVHMELESRVSSFHASRLEDSRENEARRSELFREVVVAQEGERQRIARDLHDETGQALTAIGLGLRGLSTTIRHGNMDQAMTTLRQLEGMATHALVELQHLITDLRPSHLDDLGLPATLRWYAGLVHERSGLAVIVKFGGQERELDPALTIVLFRIAQEALNNVVKHAQASKVNILVNFEEDGIRLRIRDDGRGFDVRAALDRKNGRASLGLIGMQERTSQLGGTFMVSLVPGRGSLVEVKVPYRQ